MQKLLSLLLILFCMLNLSACDTMNNQDIGTIVGGVAGGLLGSTVGGGSGKFVAVAAGTLAGAYIGGSVGKNMDQNDRMRMRQALENNSIGEPAYWRNAHTGKQYRVTPIRDVAVHGNRYCREYRTVAEIGGKKEVVYGKACRQPDGTWKAVK